MTASSRNCARAWAGPIWPPTRFFATNDARVANRDAMRAALIEPLMHADVATWIDRFAAAGVPSAPINTIPQALADPQVAHRGMVIGMEHPLAGGDPHDRQPDPLPQRHDRTIAARRRCWASMTARCAPSSTRPDVIFGTETIGNGYHGHNDKADAWSGMDDGGAMRPRRACRLPFAPHPRPGRRSCPPRPPGDGSGSISSVSVR